MTLNSLPPELVLCIIDHLLPDKLGSILNLALTNRTTFKLITEHLHCLCAREKVRPTTQHYTSDGVPESLLLWAVRKDRLPLVQQMLLLNPPAPRTSRSDDPASLPSHLRLALSLSRPTIVDYIFSQPSTPPPPPTSCLAQHLLYSSIDRRQPHLTRYLLNVVGVPASATGLSGIPVIIRAAQITDDDSVLLRMLLRCNPPPDINARDPQGWTALHRVSGEPGKIGSLKLLLRAGADVHARIPASGHTPLMVAVRGWGMSRVVRELVMKAGAEVDALDDRGWASLDYVLHDISGRREGRRGMGLRLVEDLLWMGAKTEGRLGRGMKEWVELESRFVGERKRAPPASRRERERRRRAQVVRRLRREKEEELRLIIEEEKARLEPNNAATEPVIVEDPEEETVHEETAEEVNVENASMLTPDLTPDRPGSTLLPSEQTFASLSPVSPTISHTTATAQPIPVISISQSTQEPARPTTTPPPPPPPPLASPTLRPRLSTGSSSVATTTRASTTTVRRGNKTQQRASEDDMLHAEPSPASSPTRRRGVEESVKPKQRMKTGNNGSEAQVNREVGSA